MASRGNTLFVYSAVRSVWHGIFMQLFPIDTMLPLFSPNDNIAPNCAHFLFITGDHHILHMSLQLLP